MTSQRTLPVLFEDSTQCCGCGACLSICPNRAISMKPDHFGFLYPIIDPDLCVGCGACIRVCAFKSKLN